MNGWSIHPPLELRLARRIDASAERLRCVPLDAPGCRLSDRSRTAPTLEQAAAAVTRVVDRLQLRDVTLIAHDLGGPAGFLAASRRADQLRRPSWRSTALPGVPAARCSAACSSVMGSAPARELDAALGWLPRATATGFGVGSAWEPLRFGGLPCGYRPLGAASLARLLPGCPCGRQLRRGRRWAARRLGGSAAADHLRSAQRSAAFPTRNGRRCFQLHNSSRSGVAITSRCAATPSWWLPAVKSSVHQHVLRPGSGQSHDGTWSSQNTASHSQSWIRLNWYPRSLLVPELKPWVSSRSQRSL